MVVIGVAVGLVLALVGGRFIQDLLFETSARDPLVLVVVSATLVGVAFVAALLPAAAARRIDPLVALRAE